jgi:hypothetical protein
MIDSVDDFLAARQPQASDGTFYPALGACSTTSLRPSLFDDWLYTGRAFSLNPLILSAGWMAAVREDFNGQTYWRLYLKARFQDGSAGIRLACLGY